MSIYIAYFKIAFRSNIVYRIDHLLGIFNTCLQIFISCSLWKILYGNHTEINGITYSMVATNSIIAQGLGNAFSLDDFAIQHKLWDGSISGEFLKPINLHTVFI